MARKIASPEATVDSFPIEGLDPLRLMAQLPLRPYHRVLDVRCGSGHLTVPLAKFLFDGKVYALDSTTSNLDPLKEKLTQIRLSNVVVITTKKQQQGIEAEHLDGALVPFVLHWVAGKEAFLREFLPLLKKGAWVAVVDWQKKATDGGPPVAQRLDEAEVIALGERIGLRFSGKRTLTNSSYLVLLRK
jgi:ubiquinone/menaquinone biosynthesis C-methylase UbiE